ncbi:MAG: tartrate dehydrogenase [Acidimicrobiia bacterium]|nr:tartrate dehydrogenase [Acidimicrobiia bacterium]
MSRQTYRIAVIAGDGIGQEVIPAGVDILRRAAGQGGFRCDFTDLPWGCEFYLKTGRMMDADWLERLQAFDAIYLGAIGAPGVSDSISARELLLPLRQRLRQFVNLRPMRLMPGIDSPLGGRTAADIDMICVRENSEGEYCGIGGRAHMGTPDELAEQTSIFTRRGIERIARYGFEIARTRPRKLLASATKSNALQHSLVLWDEVVEEVARDYPDVTWRKYYVDAIAARMVTHPQTLDVIIASNLFGDILTDIGSAISGSLGVGPSGNINPDRTAPSMFEPIHGSAPDIAGKGIANPVAAVWAGAMMLEHLGEPATAARVVSAIGRVLAEGSVKTPDLGGEATTKEMAAAIAAHLE